MSKVDKLIKTEEVIKIEILETYEGDDTYEVLSERLLNKSPHVSLTRLLRLGTSFPFFHIYLENGDVLDDALCMSWETREKHLDTLGEEYDSVVHPSEWETHNKLLECRGKDDLPDYNTASLRQKCSCGTIDRSIFFKDGDMYKGTFVRNVTTLNTTILEGKRTMFTVSLKSEFLTEDRYSYKEYSDAFDTYLKNEYFKIYNEFKSSIKEKVDYKSLNVQNVIDNIENKSYFGINRLIKKVNQINLPDNVSEDCQLIFQIDDTQNMFAKRGMLQLFFKPNKEDNINEPIDTPNCSRIEDFYSFHFTELDKVQLMNKMTLDEEQKVLFGVAARAKSKNYVVDFGLTTELLANLLSIDDYMFLGFNNYLNKINEIKLLPGLEDFVSDVTDELYENYDYNYQWNMLGSPRFQQWSPYDVFNADEDNEYTFLCFFEQIHDANLNFMIKKDALAKLDFSTENIIGWSDNT